MTAEADQLRAAQAQALLNDPLLKGAFDAVEALYTEKWKATADNQERERERLWIMLMLVGKVRDHLEQAVATGRFVEESAKKTTAVGAAHGIRRLRW